MSGSYGSTVELIKHTVEIFYITTALYCVNVIEDRTIESNKHVSNITRKLMDALGEDKTMYVVTPYSCLCSRCGTIWAVDAEDVCRTITLEVVKKTTKPRHCSGCGAAHYCCEDAQKFHWQKHKTVCSKLLAIRGVQTKVNMKRQNENYIEMQRGFIGIPSFPVHKKPKSVAEKQLMRKTYFAPIMMFDTQRAVFYLAPWEQ